MADNVTLPGTGQAVAADDIGSAKYQRIKLIHGADGVNDGDVSSINPLPVQEKLITDNPKPYIDTNFVTGNSPASLDFNTDFGRNITEGFIINDGPGNFTIAFSENGTVFGGEHTLKKNEVYSWGKRSVDTLRITWIVDSAYRVSIG